jgi:hypothetical protein
MQWKQFIRTYPCHLKKEAEEASEMSAFYVNMRWFMA